MKTIKIGLSTKTEVEFIDITKEVRDFIARENISSGICHIFVQHTTCGIVLMEYEAGAIADMEAALRKIAPPDKNYCHNTLACDRNGHAHIRGAIIGSSVSIPIIGGSLALGIYQSIVFIDCDDTQPRERTIIVSLLER
ncbi:MAG: YjbQ family protein [Candidatus Portnoybacteria bacterium]|nr:YjbQ family protein [Candidatus Portnoybacteria bacterium]